MQLDCKVIKKWQPPISILTLPPFQGYPTFLAKFLVPPEVTQFLEGPTPQGGFQLCNVVFQMFYLLIFGPFFHRLSQSNSSGKRLSPNFYMRFCHLSRNDVKASMSQKTL